MVNVSIREVLRKIVFETLIRGQIYGTCKPYLKSVTKNFFIIKCINRLIIYDLININRCDSE